MSQTYIPYWRIYDHQSSTESVCVRLAPRSQLSTTTVVDYNRAPSVIHNIPIGQKIWELHMQLYTLLFTQIQYGYRHFQIAL